MKPNRFRFRAWDKNLKKVVPCADLFRPHGQEDDLVATVVNEYYDPNAPELAPPYTHGKTWEYVGRKQKDIVLMQSTGLADKNGKEIFEGDVVRDSYETCSVVWIDGCGSWWFLKDIRMSDKAFLRDCVDTYEECQSRLWEADRMCVIGNIYENPELLK